MGLLVVVYPGGYRVVSSMDEAVEIAVSRGGSILYCRGGDLVLLRVEKPVAVQPSREPVAAQRVEAPRVEAPAAPRRVAAVFDQMFRGFAEIVAREVPGVELHEIVGRGLRAPVRAGRITKWPANDDYDVLKVVERLAGEVGRVHFFTGDKRLARQAEALGDERIIVHYMPPNEYTGKEELARAMIEALREDTRR